MNLAGSLLLSAAVGAINAANVPDPENIKLQRRSGVGVRHHHIGQVRVGGQVVFRRAEDGHLYQVIVHGEGECHAIDSVYIDKKRVQTEDGWLLDAPWFKKKQVLIKSLEEGLAGGLQVRPDRSYIRVLHRLGQDPAEAYSEIASVWPAWDATHRLDGMTTSLMIAEASGAAKFHKIYPRGEPELEISGRWAKAHDPRTGEIGYTDNAALLTAYFIEHARGVNRAGWIDQDLLAAAASVADSGIALESGATEPRYRLSGTWAENEAPGDVLQRMVDAYAGEVRLMPSGKIGIFAGAWEEPTITLEDSDIEEVLEIDEGPTGAERYTELPFVYVDRGLNFTTVTGDPWVNEDLEEELGQTVQGESVNLVMCPSHRQGRAVAEIRSAMENPSKRMTLRLAHWCLPIIAERFVRVDSPDVLGWSGYARVVADTLTLDTVQPVVTLQQIDPASYAPKAEHEGTPQEIPENEDSETGVEVEFTVAAQGVHAAQGAPVAGLRVEIVTELHESLQPVVFYTPSGAADWQSGPAFQNGVALLSPLVDGQAYDVAVGLLSSEGAEVYAIAVGAEQFGEYAAIEATTATADATPPLAPAIAVADLGGGLARVSVTDTGSASAWRAQIYRDGTLVADPYIRVGETVQFTDEPGAGAFAWTARVLNASAVAGALSASASETIT